MSEAMQPPPIPTAAPVLQDPPGYQGAKICGILSLLFAITCIGFPVAIILGIVALVKHGKAKRLAQEAPASYRMPSGGPLTMGIIGLCLGAFAVPTLGIGAAVAIPAFVAQHNRARQSMLESNLQKARMQAEELTLEGNMTPDQLLQALLSDASLAQMKNPYDSGAPALEKAEKPSRTGVIALWPSTEEGSDGQMHVRLLLNATYPDGDQIKELNEEVEFPSSPAVPPAPQEPAGDSATTP